MRRYLRNSVRLGVPMMLVWLLTACQELPRYFIGEKPVARVGERELTLAELQESMPEGLSSADSAAYARTTVDRWVRKQLKLQEAEELFSASAEDIDELVEEYRQALLIRRLDRYCVDRMVDTTFTAEEIAAYYEAHQADFKLDRTLVKGRIVRLPKSYRQTRRLKELMASKKESSQQDFHDLCLKNEFELNDYREGWIDYADFLTKLPTLRSKSYDELLTKSGIQEMNDASSLYWFQIDEVRRAGDPTPIERLRQTIRRILFNQRQQQVIRDHEEQLYEEARLNEGFHILGDTTAVRPATVKSKTNNATK